MGADAYFVMLNAMNACVENLTSKCVNEKIHQTKIIKVFLVLSVLIKQEMQLVL